MPIHENAFISLWHALGSPSYISGALLGGLCKLWLYTYSKIKELESLHGEVSRLEEKIKGQKEMYNTRIDDLKDTLFLINGIKRNRAGSSHHK